MICEAWHTVTHYHLRLGPTVNGNAENFLEHAINTLNAVATGLSQNPSKEELKKAIKECWQELKKDKYRLTDYVPYKLLYPFFEAEGMEEGLSYIKKDQHTRLIAYMAKLSGDEKLFYTILDTIIQVFTDMQAFRMSETISFGLKPIRSRICRSRFLAFLRFQLLPLRSIFRYLAMRRTSCTDIVLLFNDLTAASILWWICPVTSMINAKPCSL